MPDSPRREPRRGLFDLVLFSQLGHAVERIQELTIGQEPTTFPAIHAQSKESRLASEQ